VISGERDKVMLAIRKKVAEEAKQIGIEIIDVRLRRVEYLEQINNSVYARMKSERARVANELRSTGFADSEKIRADADKQRVVILAEAYREAEKNRGAGDAEAAQIYAQAFGQNPEFYRFYRSLEAYRATFKNKSDVLVVDPNSDFFKYFKNPGVGTTKSADKK
jgi:membrane protease subunit HflC